MKALLYPLIAAFIGFASVAKAEDQELPPLDPQYEGVHGMVLMSKASTIFAYHLPLYHKPHDAQVLYKLDVKDVALVQLVRDNDLITIKPQPFNLERLIRGEKMAITADVYIGHFERDGLKVYDDMVLNFADQLYARKLDEIKPSSKQQEYDVVNYRKTNSIYIHRLQEAPSYDHLLHIDVNSSCLSKFTTSSAVPKRSELQFKFINCGTMTPFYFETEDFKK